MIFSLDCQGASQQRVKLSSDARSLDFPLELRGERGAELRLVAHLQALLIEELTAEVSRRLGPDGDLAATFEAVAEGRIDPYSAVQQILTPRGTATQYGIPRVP